MIFLNQSAWSRARNSFSDKGYTLLEVLTVVAIIAILAAIATPSWLRYVANRRVTAARDEVRQGIVSAQQAAIFNRSEWRFSIRDAGDRLEWTTHPNNVSWQDVSVWYALHPSITFYDSDTTMVSSGDTYYVKFGFKGEVLYRISTVTLDSRDGVANNKCVVISTLIGATRKGEEHPYKRGDRSCY